MSGESDYDLSELTIIINELSEHAILPFLEKLHEYFKQSKSTMSSRAKCDHAQVHQILAEVHGSNLEPHLDMMIEDIIECLCDPQPLVQGAAADAFAVLVCLASKDVETTVDKVADALIHQMICKDGGRQEVAASGIITVAQKLWEKKPVLLDYIYRLLLKTAPHVETSEGQGLIFDCLATLAEIDESTSIRHCAQLVSCWSKLLSLHDDGISLVVVSNVANISEAFGTKLLSETELATDLINHLEECCEAPELYEHANHALGTLLRLSNALEKQNAEDDAPRRAIPPPKYVPQMPKVLPSKVAPTTMPNQTIAPSQSQLPWQDSQKQILSSDKSAFHHPARQSPDPVTGRRGGTSPISAIPSAYIARIRQAQYAKTEQRSSTPGSSPSQEQNLAQSIAHLSESLRELMAITQDGFTQMTKRIERLEEAFGSLSSRMTPDRPWKSSPTQLQSQSSFSVAQRPAIGGFNIDTSVQSARQTPVLAASLPPKSIVLTDSPADALHAAMQAIAIGNVRVAYETIMSTNPVQPGSLARVVNLTSVAALEKISRETLTRVLAAASTSMNSELIEALMKLSVNMVESEIISSHLSTMTHWMYSIATSPSPHMTKAAYWYPKMLSRAEK